MAHRYKLRSDFEHIESLTFLKRGEVIEYMRDLNAYVKVKPYGMVQVAASIVHKHPELFELLPPHEESEYSTPSVLDEYTYLDSKIEPFTKKYSGKADESKMIDNYNYFMGPVSLRDAKAASILVKMMLQGIKHVFGRTIELGIEYYYYPWNVFEGQITSKVYQADREDLVNRLMGNCFPFTEDGLMQVKRWREINEPALKYFLMSKY